MLNTAAVKENVNLQALVESDLGPPVKKAGGVRHWLCPFHADHKSPSLAVWPDHWHCYGCGEHGDAITWREKYHHEDFKAACSALGALELGAGQPVVSRRVEEMRVKLPPSPQWQDRSMEFMVNSYVTLWGSIHDKGSGLPEVSAKARDWLSKRGLVDQAMLEWAYIGFNAEDRHEDPAEWGLPPDPDGKKIWLPRGIVIPQWQAGAYTLWGLKVRRAAGDPKYIHIRGSVPSLYGVDTLNGQGRAFVCEGEFDALLLRQHVGDVAGVVTMGGATCHDIDSWLPHLLSIKRLFICTDNDPAGEKAVDHWLSLTKRARRVRPPGGAKDITDAWTAGADLRDWAQAAIGQG
jgi:DNA primase